uniref:Uncharacterized protein n=1 Tax=Timema poppense TaxID=170557 RepID=A0A7R9H0U5_TIMPO|nr:unnamed protein product [Timema poppensis]
MCATPAFLSWARLLTSSTSKSSTSSVEMLSEGVPGEVDSGLTLWSVVVADHNNKNYILVESTLALQNMALGVPPPFTNSPKTYAALNQETVGHACLKGIIGCPSKNIAKYILSVLPSLSSVIPQMCLCFSSCLWRRLSLIRCLSSYQQNPLYFPVSYRPQVPSRSPEPIRKLDPHPRVVEGVECWHQGTPPRKWRLYYKLLPHVRPTLVAFVWQQSQRRQNRRVLGLSYREMAGKEDIDLLRHHKPEMPNSHQKLPQRTRQLGLEDQHAHILHLSQTTNSLINPTHLSISDALILVAIEDGWASFSLNTLSMTDNSVEVVSTPQNVV